MTLVDIITDDLNIFFNSEDFAESVVYTPFGGSPKTITAIIRQHEDIDDSKWQTAVQASALLWVKASDVASPDYKDTVTSGGFTWTVMSINRLAGSNVWKMDLRRDLRPTFKR